MKPAFYLEKLSPNTEYAPEFIVKGRNIQHQKQNIGGYYSSNAESNYPSNRILVGKNSFSPGNYYIEISAIYDSAPTQIPVEAFKEGQEYNIQISSYRIVDNSGTEYNFSDSEFQLFGYFPNTFHML
jgi:hypothetical protein